jgi:hypothetical protein
VGRQRSEGSLFDFLRRFNLSIEERFTLTPGSRLKALSGKLYTHFMDNCQTYA